jgi:hypothetical protein
VEVEVVLVNPQDSPFAHRFQAVAVGSLSPPQVLKPKQAAPISDGWGFFARPLAVLELALEDDVEKIKQVAQLAYNLVWNHFDQFAAAE